MQFSSAKDKLDAITKLKGPLDVRAAEYQTAQNKLQERVRDRDALGNKLKNDHAAVNKLMEDLKKMGDEVKIKMMNESERYNKAIEALQDLSSNDLTGLIDEKAPSNEVLSIMNSVNILIGKPLGWQAVNEAVMSQGFMHSVGNMDYKDPTQEMLD